MTGSRAHTTDGERSKGSKRREPSPKYSRPPSQLWAITTFGMTIREVSEPLKIEPCVVHGEERRRELPRKAPTKSAWAASETHVLSFKSQATEDYLHRHPSLAQRVSEVPDAVDYRKLILKDAATVDAAKDLKFYDESTHHRLKISEYVYGYRQSRGEKHSGNLKSLYDGLPLSTFGRSTTVPKEGFLLEVSTPGPLDYAPPVRCETPKLAASTMKSSNRDSVIFSRTGLVGHGQSRQATPLSQVAVWEEVKSRPATSQDFPGRPTSGFTEIHSHESSKRTSPATAALTAPKVKLRADLCAAQVAIPSVMQVPAIQALRLKLHPDDAIINDNTNETGHVAGTTSPVSHSQTASPSERSPEKEIPHLSNPTGFVELNAAGAQGVEAPAAVGPRGVLSRSSKRSASRGSAILRAVTPLGDLLSDVHFAGVGGTWEGAKFIATNTHNAHYKKQEEKRRQLLRIHDSCGSDDVPSEWLARQR